MSWTSPCPAAKPAQQVLDRYLPVLDQLRLALPRRCTRSRGDIVVVSHGAAIRLVSAVLAGVDGELRHRPPPREHRVGGAGSDHRRPVELRAVGRADARRSAPRPTATGSGDSLRSADPMG